MYNGTTPRAEAAVHNTLFRARSKPPGARPHYDVKPPWVDPPEDAEPFDFSGIIATPAAGTSAAALTVRVPNGYSGVIRRLSHNYTGGGFVPGSGDLTWRILVDGRAVKNYDAINVEFGNPNSPRECFGIRLRSGQTVTYQVAHDAASGLPVLGTSIVVFLTGYFWPERA
jgi:hypothetical protein